MNEQNQMTETEQILDTPLPGDEQTEEIVEKDTEEVTEDPKTEETQDTEDTSEENVEEPDEKPKKKKVSGFTRRLNREREKAAALEEENRRLKQMYADLSLDNAMLKDVLSKKF